MEWFQPITRLAIPVALSHFANASACMMDAPPVQNHDLQNASGDMIAFQGIIEKSSAKGSTKAKPHDGFILTLKISKVFKGTNLGSTVNVIYGPCHNMPGAIGEKINVLALPEKAGGWYAPQFWTTQKVTPQK